MSIDEEKEPDHQNSDNRYEELQQKYEELLMEKMDNEQAMKAEIEQLKDQVHSGNSFLETVCRQNFAHILFSPFSPPPPPPPPELRTNIY